jgi:uncharacterized protein
MSGLIDTSILLYAVDTEAEEHEAAVEFLQDAVGSRAVWFVTEGIVYEFLRTVTDPRQLAGPLDWQSACGFLAPILARPSTHLLAPTERHWATLGQVLSELIQPGGNLFVDIRTVTLMREHGVRTIYTANADYLQFSGIEVINPLTEISSAGPRSWAGPASRPPAS